MEFKPKGGAAGAGLGYPVSGPQPEPMAIFPPRERHWKSITPETKRNSRFFVSRRNSKHGSETRCYTAIYLLPFPMSLDFDRGLF